MNIYLIFICDLHQSSVYCDTLAYDLKNPKLNCKPSNNFGINQDHFNPCIFLKFDAKAEWNPEYYDVNELPENMPSDLKESIKKITHPNATLWVSCEEEGNVGGQKNAFRSLSFYPDHGFPGYYFPCKSEELCVDPLIALQIQNPKSEWNFFAMFLRFHYQIYL